MDREGSGLNLRFHATEALGLDGADPLAGRTGICFVAPHATTGHRQPQQDLGGCFSRCARIALK